MYLWKIYDMQSVNYLYHGRNVTHTIHGYFDDYMYGRRCFKIATFGNLPLLKTHIHTHPHTHMHAHTQALTHGRRFFKSVAFRNILLLNTSMHICTCTHKCASACTRARSHRDVLLCFKFYRYQIVFGLFIAVLLFYEL